MTVEPAPPAPRSTDDDAPLRYDVGCLGVLVLLDGAVSASHLGDHVPGWFAGGVGWLWGLSVLGLTFSVGERASTAWRFVAAPVLTAFTLFVGLRVPDRGGWPAELHALAWVAGPVALALVLVPPMLAGKRAWDRRHPAPTASQRLGLASDAEPATGLPLRWSTGGRAVVLDDVGDRRLQVIKLVGDLWADRDLTVLTEVLRRPEHGPMVPLVIATGLSRDDASALVTALQGCGAEARVL
ncbi:hypothetical protein [Luteimicrobium sp. DT211]|uniref:hypothetical protein n=1 Tax=Luteimicrobium sp. DT211 TaxID=3393412 RepID=UPI003CF681EE